MQQIKKYRPQFIIFDSIQSLSPKMVSTSATKWIIELMKPIAEVINAMGIGQLWLHHPAKGNKEQHGTGARTWGITLELWSESLTTRGINFNLTFPGKKKDDLGDNPDFEGRNVVLRRNEKGISEWVVTPLVTDDAGPAPREAHRPNESARLALVALDNLVTAKFEADEAQAKTNKTYTRQYASKYEVWVSCAYIGTGCEWFDACVKAGITASDNRQTQIRQFKRAFAELQDARSIERDMTNATVRLWPASPPPSTSELTMDTRAAGSA
jgi:hypothetical protein